MRLGPRRIVCCHGWAGFICWADWANHALLCNGYNHQLCDQHEKAIREEHIISVYWAAH